MKIVIMVKSLVRARAKSLGSIKHYVNASGGHFALLISDKQINSGNAFRDAFAKARGRVSSDIDFDVE